MAISLTKIRRIRGWGAYDEGVRHLKVVAQGGLEGAHETYLHQAQRLLSVNNNLNEHRRNMIVGWLGKGRHKNIEEALIRMEQRIEKDKSQGRRKEQK